MLNLYSNTLIVTIQDVFCALNYLLELDLSFNKMISFEGWVSVSPQKKNLLSLNLAGNNLSTIRWEIWVGLTQLSKLDLHKNNIKHFENASFKPLENLMELYLQNNSLTYLHMSSLTGLVNLKKLELRFNPLLLIRYGAAELKMPNVLFPVLGITAKDHQLKLNCEYLLHEGKDRWYIFCNVSTSVCPGDHLFYSVYVCLPKVRKVARETLKSTHIQTILNSITTDDYEDYLWQDVVQSPYNKGKDLNINMNSKGKISNNDKNEIDKEFNIGISFVGPCGIMLMSGLSFVIWRVRKNYQKKKRRKENNPEIIEDNLIK